MNSTWNDVMVESSEIQSSAAIVNMPYSTLMYPSLSTGLIKARLNEGGIPSRAWNLSFLFAERIGLVNYQMLSLQKGQDPLVGEWLFAEEAWKRSSAVSDRDFIKTASKTPIAAFHRDMATDWLITAKREIVPKFLDEAAGLLISSGAGVIGFSCSFFQTLSSLALIRRIKSLNPDVKVVCGGSCFHDIMGRELFSKFDLLDAVSLGEADDILIPLFEALLAGKDPVELQGIIYRTADGSISIGPACRPVSAKVLEANPVPDFDEYFNDLQRVGMLDDPLTASKLFLAMETSRGCWKGEKQHCAFCGLNNKGLEFRRVSSSKARDTIEKLTDRYPLRKIQVADCIMPREFAKDLFPDLAKRPVKGGITFLAESRTTMTREEVRAMAKAGMIYLQAGIEGLSTNMLRAMRKGVTAIKNVHFLKLCRIYGIHPLWNIMMRVPGERREDFAEVMSLIPKIVHFTPPFWGARVVEMQRFSPYFTGQTDWAANIRPRPYYKALYPDDFINIDKVAYFFDADWKDVLQDEKLYGKLVAKTDAWINVWRLSDRLPTIEWIDLHEGEMQLTDTRSPSRTGKWVLDPFEASVYKAIDDPATIRLISDRLPAAGTHGAETSNTETPTVRSDKDETSLFTQISNALESFVQSGLAIREKGLFLGLAIPVGTPEPDPSFRRTQVRMDLMNTTGLL